MLGRFVGIAENVGNAMTFKVLTSEGKIIHCSVIRSAAGEGTFINARADSDAAKLVVSKEEATAGQDQDGMPFERKKYVKTFYGPSGTSELSWDNAC